MVTVQGPQPHEREPAYRRLSGSERAAVELRANGMNMLRLVFFLRLRRWRPDKNAGRVKARASNVAFARINAMLLEVAEEVFKFLQKGKFLLED